MHFKSSIYLTFFLWYRCYKFATRYNGRIPALEYVGLTVWYSNPNYLFLTKLIGKGSQVVDVNMRVLRHGAWEHFLESHEA